MQTQEVLHITRDIHGFVIDLFSGGGVIAEAFYDSVGVDIDRESLEYYPHQKVLGSGCKAPFRSNAVTFAHASPPCQLFNSRSNKQKHVNLIPQARSELRRLAKYWSIENVATSPLRKDLMLCHSMFELPGARHRHFELNFHAEQLECNEHNHIYRNDGKPFFAHTKGSRSRNQRFLGCRDLPAKISGNGVPPEFMRYILDQLTNPIQMTVEEWF